MKMSVAVWSLVAVFVLGVVSSARAQAVLKCERTDSVAQTSYADADVLWISAPFRQKDSDADVLSTLSAASLSFTDLSVTSMSQASNAFGQGGSGFVPQLDLTSSGSVIDQLIDRFELVLYRWSADNTGYGLYTVLPDPDGIITDGELRSQIYVVVNGGGAHDISVTINAMAGRSRIRIVGNSSSGYTLTGLLYTAGEENPETLSESLPSGGINRLFVVSEDISVDDSFVQSGSIASNILTGGPGTPGNSTHGVSVTVSSSIH